MIKSPIEDRKLNLLMESRPTGPVPGTIVKVKTNDGELELEVGSPAWRDYQQNEFDRLVDNPDRWEFNVTPDQEQRIKSAYVAYPTITGTQTLPDASSIRTIISNSFEQPKEIGEQPSVDIEAMFEFWSEFNSDMPDVLKSAGATHSLGLVWSERKIKSVLERNNLTYLEWEEEELACNLRSPDSMRLAAKGIEDLLERGFSLFHLDIDDGIVRWHLRKGVNVQP